MIKKENMEKKVKNRKFCNIGDKDNVYFFII